ncbi:MAG: oligosaccharide flippase family protein [Rhodocyclaceae bacterium]|jgi:O-antigen/teichoic acid export membrane protein|nr:oligosaccharide flippase family protein [Rhodocyclaceae bacterium]MCA3107716.1 oligosaccharide flippase family protein [Rhodocyclaceae bacterium]MCA4901770.1 oligosaccharide flippase family protein [Rhodocyclaceae bacterium]
MTRVKRNIAANLAGRGWSILLSFALIPLYIRYLGIEAYGLIGFYLTLTAVATIVDPGFGTTLTREFARLGGVNAAPDPASAAAIATPHRPADLLRTLEVLTLAIALAIAVAVAVLSPAIAGGWLRADTVDPAVLTQAVALMGLALAAQWPTPFYSGGLSGLQHQVTLNAILAAGATLRGIGSLLVLAFVANDIRAFFAWQAVAFALQSLLMGVMLWRQFPGEAYTARMRLASLRGVWRFTLGVWAITMLGTTAAHADKVMLSTFLPLAQFGYYMLAAAIASLATLLVGPIFSAVMPRLTELVAAGNTKDVIGFYHGASQLLAAATLPIALTLIVFAPEALRLWTGDTAIATSAAPIVQALAAAAALNALVNTPYALQLAHGWTRLGVGMGVFNLAVAIPALWWGATRHGAVGAAVAYALVCLANLAIGMTLLHARYLRGEALTWLMRDTLPPALASALVVAIARLLVPADAGPLVMAACLTMTIVVALAASALSARSTRGYLIGIASGLVVRRNA